jgi:hypothetical protein
MKRKLLALCLSSTMLFAGCAARVKNVTNLPAGVTLQQAQAWDSAIADLHKIASTVSTVRQTLTQLHAAQYNGAPILSDVAYGEAMRMIGNVDNLELSAEVVLRQSPQNFSVAAKQKVTFYVQSISTEIQQLNTLGATGIKNPTSLKTVNSLLADLTATVALILSL